MQLTPPRLVALVAGLAVAGCATPGATGDGIPPLRLAPAALGHPLALQQHVTLRAAGHEQQMDVLLEADAADVKLAIVALGQVAARIEWDGRALTDWRAPWWPASVPGARILDDLQLALWPLAAVQAALPTGWQASEEGPDDGDGRGTRTLSNDGTPVLVVRHPSANVIELDQRREHYQLTIVSQPATAQAAP